MPQSKQIFFDAKRKRWRRLRIILDTTVIVITLLVAFFITTIIRGSSVPGLALPGIKKPYHALKDNQKRKPTHAQNTHRKTKRPASQVVLNSDEGIRGAFYVKWDAASFASLKEYYPQIDLLFPEWMHVLTTDGRLQAVTELNTLYDVMDEKGKPRPVDDKVMPFLKGEKAQTEVLPLVNNFDPITNEWRPELTAQFMANSAARQRFRGEIMRFLATDQYKGLTLDIEAFPETSRDDYRALVQELYDDLHAKGMKLYIAVPVNDKTFDYAGVAKISDGLILMNYDQHYPGGDPGAVAGQDWFLNNLRDALKVIPKEKIICAVGNYGYDWAMKKGQKKGTPPEAVHSVSAQEAWLEASDAATDVVFDDDAMNPHFAYLDDNNVRHDVWFLDGVTALNQMRSAHALGIYTFALWRLGSEDRSLWAVWDKPYEAGAPTKLETVPPGQDVDIEGQGEILRIGARPAPGERQIKVDPNNLVGDEVFKNMPQPYEVNMYGSSPNKIAITFDDGPDPEWTPKVLDVLKEKGVKATFFLIGVEAQKYPSITKRVYNEGHEIGNHTFTHPDISNISKRYFEVELNLTERFFEGKLGVKPVLFRPPYSIDQEPDTADQVRPLELAQDLGYITVGDKVDPNDWHDNPRRSASQIVKDVLANLPPCAPSNLACGNIILLHDGGGDRRETVKALPQIIDGLRARGYEVVPVSGLMGKTRADIMPPITTNERWAAWIDGLNFSLFAGLSALIIFVFFVGDVLMSGRLVLVGALAIFDRFHRRNTNFDPNYQPAVAVLIPAYNEEKVIERTVRSVLDSDYRNLRVIVIDDGSKDATLEITRDSFQKEITAGHVTVLTKPNSGKAEALNYGLEYVTEELFIGIDADTVIAPDAVSKLVLHFSNPKVGAMAGNAKVGNRVNLWTRWQALEYITSQNFERRALNTLNAVSVVPGAIGAWRTAAVRAAGGYHPDTVAEDADLTMALLQAGYWVNYEDRALAYTEAPSTATGLMRQRFRWSFGIMQSVWKHRAAVKQKGALGWVAIPNMVIFQILLPLVSPFIDIMFVVGAATYFVNKHFHPESANPASFHRLVLYFALFMVIDFIASTIAFTLERQQPGGKRDFLLLGHVWLQRFAYRQLFSIVLFRTLKRAMEGGGFAWDKLERAATVKQPIAVRREERLNDGEIRVSPAPKPALDMSVNVAGIALKNPVLAASGSFGYGVEFEDVVTLNRLGGFVVKGLSREPMAGNPPPRLFETAAGMLNAIGLQNIGARAFLEEKLPLLRRIKNIVFFCNVFGHSQDEYEDVVRMLNEGEGISAYELNVSCPNTKCGGISFGSDPKMLFGVVSSVKKIANHPLIVKLSPNVTSIPDVARAAEDAGADAISLVNTFVAMSIDAETRKPRISNVTAGLSGPAIKPIALRMVWEAAKTVKIPVIGIGGISTAEDVVEFMLAGASAIEVGTVNFWDPCACETLVDSLEKWCLERRIEKVSDLTGGLQLDSGPETQDD